MKEPTFQNYFVGRSFCQSFVLSPCDHPARTQVWLVSRSGNCCYHLPRFEIRRSLMDDLKTV